MCELRTSGKGKGGEWRGGWGHVKGDAGVPPCSVEAAEMVEAQ